jgi:formylglycine-generating enzyme required for sulfatase activity
MEFEMIPAGSFDMGSPSTETGRFEWEGPLHNVDIKKAFYLGKYEVTQKQWVDIMGNNPSVFKDCPPTYCENQPVELVTWDDVSKFIKKLNEKERTNKYRLPSESEWEYAARAGTSTKYYFGDNDSELINYAWFTGDSAGKPHLIGKKKSNRWGLYDMNGNVFEWVQDKWLDNYNTSPSDGSAWIGGLNTNRVARGGSWNSVPEHCRSAFRFYAKQSDSSSDLGFRVAMDV